jgi:hypothetical protein
LAKEESGAFVVTDHLQVDGAATGWYTSVVLSRVRAMIHGGALALQPEDAPNRLSM